MYKILRALVCTKQLNYMGVFTFALSMVGDVASAIVSFYVRETLRNCWPSIPEIARSPLQSRS